MVGIGPGGKLDRTRRAELIVTDCDVVAGYTTYLRHIADLTGGKELICTGMRQEVQRCRAALARASEGSHVALVSSGDAGIYGMAGLAIELAQAEEFDVPIEVVPGVTAASAAAAACGAPLMLDFAVISLSDLLVPWERIRRRLEAVAAAGMVTVLYNPRSKKRVRQLEQTVEIFRQHRPGRTPAAVGTSVGCENQRLVLTQLDELLTQEVNMRSVVIIGNEDTDLIDSYLVTRRGYQL